MFKLTKYLKPFIGSILVVIVLLFTQAISELSLPDYMSSIVNVGIQQGGIESSVPTVIRESELEKLSIFISESDYNFVKENYKVIAKKDLSQKDLEKYLKKYPSLEEETLLEINTKEEETLEKIADILSTPELIVLGIESGEYSEKMNLPEGNDPFEILKMLPKENLNTMLDIITAKFENMPDSMI